MTGRATAAAAIIAAALGGCGGPSPDGDIAVSAATSLKRPLSRLAAEQPDPRLRLELAGSDSIAAAVRSGRRPDVVILAGTGIAADLQGEGLIGNPVGVAANSLVIATRSGGRNIARIEQLAAPGLKLALGSSSVPVGSYADAVISKLPPAVGRAILANVATREPDAAGVVGKLRSGAVDAAITYRTDVLASSGALEATPIAARLDPAIEYRAAVVNGSPRTAAARRLIASLRSGRGRELLAEAGFRTQVKPER